MLESPVARQSDAADDFARRGLFMRTSPAVMTSTKRSDDAHLLTLKEAQAFCFEQWQVRVSMTTLRRHVRKGALVVVRIGVGPKAPIRLRRDVVRRFFAADIGQD